ncbi:MAG: SCO family protein [Rubricoccaceae bacterium]
MRFVPLLLFLVLAACRSEPSGLSVVDDLADTTWSLVDQDSAAVAFPQDLAGRPVLLSAVYTRCPDICPVTMANMTRVRRALEADSARVTFVTVSFDPTRDTPSVLRAYARMWRLGPEWSLLTGSPDEVAHLMDRLGIRVEEVPHPGGEGPPLIDHSDRAFLLDARGRIVETYSGTATPPDMIAGDIRSLLP